MHSDLKDLRNEFKSRRKCLTPREIEQASREAAQQLLRHAVYVNARRVALYFAVNGELDPVYITDTSTEQGKQIFVPVLTPQQSLLFAPYTPGDRLITNRFGIQEPDCEPRHCVAAAALDLIIVPLLAFDVHGNRLGMGAGYYDRTLAETTAGKPFKTGYAYEWQRVERLPAQPWDVALDYIVTEAGVYKPDQRH